MNLFMVFTTKHTKDTKNKDRANLFAAIRNP